MINPTTRVKVEYKAEMKVLEDVVTMDTLKPLIERFNTVEEGLAETRAMRDEITTVGKFVDTHGFSPGRDFHRIAAIPSSVWSAVLEVFPDAGVNKPLFYALLKGPLRDYDLRQKPTLT